MIKIIRAEILGYCMGVRRAVEAVERALLEYPHHKVWTFGPLIHNRIALENLASRGVEILEDRHIDKLSVKDVVVIRAHGVAPKVKKTLENTGCILIDATCPRVMLSQKRAADFASKGFNVIIAGDKNHGEVTGIAGCAIDPVTGKNLSILVENRQDAEKLISVAYDENIALPEKAILISQTTISREEYDAVADVLSNAIKNIKVFDTICPATMERQKALQELKGKVDGVLIIGGKNSANTQRLLMSGERIFPYAELIENASEIPENFRNLKRVGLSAGASTPDEVIDSIEFDLLNN